MADSITSFKQFEGDTDLRVSLGPARGVQEQTDRPPRGDKRAQRDTVLKLIAIHFAKIQNWGRC